MDKDITDGHGRQTQTHLNGHQPALAHDYIDDLFPLNNIPPELMALPQWVAVKLVPRDDGTDKYDKPPYNPYRPAYGASTTDPTTWASYPSQRRWSPDMTTTAQVLCSRPPM